MTNNFSFIETITWHELWDGVISSIAGEPGIVNTVIYWFWAFIGVLFILLAGTALRDKTPEKEIRFSPSKFSWGYLFYDNTRRIAFSVLCVLVSIRFSPDILGWEMTEWKAFCLGVSFDGIGLLIKQKTTLFDPKKTKIYTDES